MSRVANDSRWTVLLPGLLLAGGGVGLANPAIAQTGNHDLLLVGTGIVAAGAVAAFALIRNA